MKGIHSALQTGFLSSVAPPQQLQLRQTPLLAFDNLGAATTSSMISSTGLDLLASPESILGKLNPDTPDWLRSVVWTDFRLAVAFFVVTPLVLLLWSAYECRPSALRSDKDINNQNLISNDAALRVLTGYWQASALLLITVLLNIQSSPVGVVTGTVAQAMIWISLNWWTSLNQEAEAVASESSSLDETLIITPLSQAFRQWRRIASWVAAVGVLVQVCFLNCAGNGNLMNNAYCAAWLEPPQTAASLLGIANNPVVGSLAMLTLAVYVGYFVYYVAIPLPKVGRDGRRPRSTFTFVDPLVTLGFLRELPEENS